MRTKHIAWCAALLLASLGAGLAAADVFVLTNGDRITGKRLRGARGTVVVETEFGRLGIPRGRVERIVKEDGTEEVLNAPAAAARPASTAGMSTARLVLIVVGKSFWLAWDPKRNPTVDPTLRMEVRLDGEPVATYTDATPDPKDLPGTTVNTFSFLQGEFEMEPSGGAQLGPPEVKPGRASLRIDVPFAASAPATRTVSVAYQFNAGSAEEPAWKDAVTAEAEMNLQRGAPTFILMRQDPGRMGFSGFPRKRMRNIETFSVVLAPGS
jgi:hypothetical protein